MDLSKLELQECSGASKYREPDPATREQPTWSLGLKIYRCETLDGTGSTEDDETDRSEVHDYGSANLISSQLVDAPNYHKPLFDFDFPCELIPSSTHGHFHFVINKPITIEQYSRLLEVLHDIGLIETGVYQRFLREKRTYIRCPDIKKPL